jgi:diguanylate cyclase (GGDEF)-like protein
MAIMLDFDKFKLVNDTYGHDAGDIVLQELGQLVRGMVRQEDLTARYGGEEFCILLPGIPLADAAGVADRVRRVVAEQRFSPLAGVPSLTVSIGVASLWRDDRGHELFTRADLAMYHAKHHGGNLVCVASQDGRSFTYSAGTEDHSRSA